MPSNENLLTMFTAKITERDGSMVIQVPEQELELGDISVEENYRVALLEQRETDHRSRGTQDADHRQRRPHGASQPPVSVGDELDVEIEDVGEQGDGVARVGQGYIIFVPDTDVGDRVTVEVGKTLENFGFAEVLTPEPVKN